MLTTSLDLNQSKVQSDALKYLRPQKSRMTNHLVVVITGLLEFSCPYFVSLQVSSLIN
jgi:hypothetical protein